MLGTLRLKLFAVLFVPVLASVLLACAASYNFLQGSYLALLEDRLTVLAHDVGGVAEANDSLGLPLASLGSLQARLEREKAQNGDIASVAVFLDDGRILFDTDRAMIGERIPDPWLPPGRLGTEDWSRATEEELVVGSPIVNSFKRPIGGIVVRVSSAQVGFRKIQAFRTVAVAGLGFLALSAVAAYLAASQVAGRLSAPILRAVQEIDLAAALVRAGDPGPAPSGPANIVPPGADTGSSDMVARIRRLIAPLDSAERTLRQMDEAA